MNKNASRGLITLAILLVVFSMIAFVIPFPRNAIFWIAYLCGIVAILFQLYIFKSSFGNDEARSRFYGFPIARLGVYYLAIQLIVSIAEIALSKFLPTWVVVILNVLILVFAIICCFTTETMRDEIAKQDEKLKKSVSNMRELQSISAMLVDQCDNSDLKNALKKLADDFRFSDPLSSDKTNELEMDMLRRIEDLQQAVTERDIEGAKSMCGELHSCLKERNRICSLSK